MVLSGFLLGGHHNRAGPRSPTRGGIEVLMDKLTTATEAQRDELKKLAAENGRKVSAKSFNDDERWLEIAEKVMA